jgi:hypothetical protein
MAFSYQMVILQSRGMFPLILHPYMPAFCLSANSVWHTKDYTPPNPDTIVDANKSLLTGAWYSCLPRGSSSAWQIQNWMLTDIHWMEYRVPNKGASESTQGAEGVCSPIGGGTIWTKQYPPELPGTKHQSKKHMIGYVAEDGLLGHQWEEIPLVPWRFYAPV